MFLSIINKPNLHNKSKEFSEEGGSIGRLDSCDFYLPDETRFISKEHAIIHFKEGTYFITDLSTNGTFLGSSLLEKGKSKPIMEGDIFKIGDYLIKASFKYPSFSDDKPIINNLSHPAEDLDKLIEETPDSLDDLILEESPLDKQKSIHDLPDDKSIDDLLADLNSEDILDLSDLLKENKYDSTISTPNLNLSQEPNHEDSHKPINELIESPSSIEKNFYTNQEKKDSLSLLFDLIVSDLNTQNFGVFFKSTVLKNDPIPSSLETESIYTQENLNLFFKSIQDKKDTILEEILKKMEEE